MCKPFCKLLLIAAVIISSCGSKGDYTSPFLKTFELVYEKDTAVLFLKRTVVEATEYDSLAYSVYSGNIVLPESGGYLGGISGSTAKGSKQVRLTFNIGKKDTVGFLNLTINGDATQMEGWKGLQLSTESNPRPLSDSVRFKAGIKEDKNAKLTFGLKQKIVTKEYPGYRYGMSADYDMEADTIPQVDTIVELDIIRGSMDSPAFQKMLDDVKASEGSGDLSLHFVSDNLLSLERFLWEDGGAHALYYWFYYSYDLNTGRRLKLLDVFRPYTLSDVADAINKNLRKQLGLKPDQSLKDAYYNYDYIGVSKNFFVTDKGIGFQYNIYEIASFASDATTVFVPFSDVRDYLNPQFLSLIGKQDNTPGEKSSSGGSARFEGKWIPAEYAKESRSENNYIVIKRDEEKYRMHGYQNGELVENGPNAFFYYDEAKDILTMTDKGYTSTITYNKDRRTITLRMPATQYDKALDVEFIRMK